MIRRDSVPGTDIASDREIRVLHVDDDEAFLDLASEFLPRESDLISVTPCTDATRAMAHIEEAAVDCIVSDYEMPGMDGLELLTTVREGSPGIPFILFTGKGSEEIASEAISAGVTDYLQKGGVERFGVLANRIEHAVAQDRAISGLEESKRRLATLVNNLPGVVYRGRLEDPWRFEFVGGRVEELTGFPVSAFVDGSVTFGEDLMDDRDRPTVADRIRSAVDRRESFEITYRIRTRSGERKHVWEQGTPVYEDGEPIALEGFVMDVTDREEHEHRLDALHSSTRDLMRAESRTEIAEITTDATREILELTVNTVLVRDDREDALVPVTETPEGRDLLDEFPTFPRGEGLVWEVFEEGTSRVFDDVRADAGVYNPDTPIRSELLVPIGEHGVYMAGSPRPAAFDEQVVSLVRMFVANVETALDRLGNLERLRSNKRALERTVQLFEALFDNPLLFIAILDVDGTIKRANGTVVEFAGSRAEDLEQRPFAEMPWWPEDAVEGSELVAWIDDAAAGDTVRFETEIIGASGDRRTLDGIIQPVTGSMGIVRELVCIGRDITDRQRRESKIQELQHRIGELIRAESREDVAAVAVNTARETLGLPLSAVHLVDEAGETLRPTEVTDEVTTQLGFVPTYHRRDPDRAFETFVWDSFLNGEPRIIENALEEDDAVWSAETPLRSGLVFPLGEHGILMTCAGEPNAFDDTDVALTELLAMNTTAALDRMEREASIREQKERLEYENDRLETFANFLSHDLRNPLSVAMGRLELLESDPAPRHREGLRAALRRMDTLIDTLLTLAREGETVDAVEPVDLRQLAERCWSHTVTDDADLRTETDLVVRADESRLAQILENLFSNAVDHGGEGVTVRVGGLDGGFYVEDDGPGVPDVDRKRAFEAGFSTDPDGLGFGLNIVQKIADAHGWTVDVTAGSEGGARFEIRGVTAVRDSWSDVGDTSATD